MTARLLGIDIGTTGVRAAVFSANGEMLADASVPCPYESPHAGWAEIDPEKWWRAVGEALAKIDLTGVDAVAVVGQAPTAVLLDANGRAKGPAILWLDTRAEAEARAMGIPAYYLGPKLDWLRKHDKLDAVTAVLQSHATITYRLTGVMATDPSTAALCLPYFDLAARTWTPDAPASLPPIHAAHEIIGRVQANPFGLAEGIPVVAGGGDFAAATLSVGVVEENEACLMLGTAGNLLIPRKSPGKDPRLINAHHVGTDRYLSLGGTLSGGAMEWLRRALGNPPHAELEAEAARIPPGANGLLFLPYLQGERTPIWDTEARGVFAGLGLRHERGHLWRAVLEGIALSFSECLHVVQQEGVDVRTILAADNGGKSTLFREILCDALGVSIEYMPSSGGTVAGAAMLAGLGCGALPNAEATKTWRKDVVRTQFENRDTHERYRELRAMRHDLYVATKATHAQLALLR